MKAERGTRAAQLEGVLYEMLGYWERAKMENGLNATLLRPYADVEPRDWRHAFLREWATLLGEARTGERPHPDKQPDVQDEEK